MCVHAGRHYRVRICRFDERRKGPLLILLTFLTLGRLSILLIFASLLLIAGKWGFTLQLHHDLLSVCVIWHHLLVLWLLPDVKILVHLLRIVVLNLILQVVQQKHLWLVQFLDDTLHLRGTALKFRRICAELMC